MILQFEVSKNAAYAVGGVFAALSISSVAIGAISRQPWTIGACIGSLCLTTSLFLLGSLSHPRSHSQSIYEAHFILHTLGGLLLTFASSVRISHAFSGEETRWKEALAYAVYAAGAAVAVGASVLECIGVPLTRYADSQVRQVGAELHLAAVGAALAASGLGLAVALWRTVGGGCGRMAAGGDMVGAVMMVVWSSFCVAQTQLGYGGQVAWYLLGVLPLGLTLLAWTAGSVPRAPFGGRRIRRTATRQPQPRHAQWGGDGSKLDFSYPMRNGSGSGGGSASSSSSKGGSGSKNNNAVQRAILRYT
ncbi:hypothetical protein GGI15_004815 [Coemansia interrupta]|uniref:Uncharacterized protein n=1 Tax=Coemansia interrupta TaxID=1126814 RepID=A0A9W8LEJ4_9FUNG|nr:hypothetical protein GGI15_004815 [Coemansia interrupta]